MSRNYPIRTQSELTGQELVPGYDEKNALAIYVVLNTLAEWVKAKISPTSYDKTINVPVNGFNYTMNDNSNNQWLFLNPGGTLATGTVVLPVKSAAIDGQELSITSSQTITALTVNANGATLNGTITTLTANAPIALRYESQTETWVQV